MKVASLFAGIGGIDLGFKQAGCEIVWANELNEFASETYRYNLGSDNLIESDIREVDVASIPAADIIVAGFPCQPFSAMGYQRGFKDPRGNLFFEIIRIVEFKKPGIVLLENVKNLIEHDNGKTFKVILNTLGKLGYVIKYKIMNARVYSNIPQDRNRIFIVAFLNHTLCDKFEFPNPIKLSVSINDIINRSKQYGDSYYYTEKSKYYETLCNRVIDNNAIYRIDDSGVATRKYTICPTLKANMGTYWDRVPILKDDFGIRKLTALECLKLQGFPEDYTFPDLPINEAYKQAGNTVCVPLVKKIAERIIEAL